MGKINYNESFSKERSDYTFSKEKSEQKDSFDLDNNCKKNITNIKNYKKFINFFEIIFTFGNSYNKLFDQFK